MADVRGTGPGRGGSAAGARPRDWSRRIEEALEKDLFVLHAQRIVDVASGETLRHELFLRMTGGDGLIPAGQFVLAAEEHGSIREIDRWVVGRALEVAAAVHPVDLNLSVRSADDELLGMLGRGIDGNGTEEIVLELSEEQLVKGRDVGEGFVRGAHELGCRIALDGFIQGGRGLVLLKSMPIDFVKLGPRFVNGLSADGRRRRKTRNATAKTHASGQRVIAQGVEDLVTLQLLQELRIDEAQGYALGRPEPLESAFPSRA
jgi:EAL domain-containing protein (putative c-di-GMP-specific phosphodiesterase class I)